MTPAGIGLRLCLQRGSRAASGTCSSARRAVLKSEAGSGATALNPERRVPGDRLGGLKIFVGGGKGFLGMMVYSKENKLRIMIQ